MVTRESVLAWQPHALESASDAIARGRSTMVGLEDELLGHGRASHWWGDARAAADLRVERLRCRLADLVAEMSVVVSALDAEVPQLRAVRDELVELLGRDLPPPLEAMTGLPGRTRALVARATACDDRIAAALQRARSGLVDAGSLSLRDAALPTHLRDLTAAELVDWSLAHPADVPPYLSAMPESVRRRLGEELAARLVDGPPTDDLELLEGLGEDEVVATSALESLGPERLVAASAALVPTAAGLRLSSERGFGAMRRALGRMLGAGTSDGEPPGARRVHNGYLDRLAREASAQIHDGRHVTPRAALAPLLRHASQSTALLTTVGGAIVDADRTSEEAGSRPGAFPLEGPHPLDGVARMYATDPVAEVMAAAADNPEAARQLLGDEERLRHLLVDRPWHDHADGPGIGALGQALETATTVDPDERSPAIARQLVQDLPQRLAALDDHSGDRDRLMAPLRPYVGAVLGEYLPSLHELMGGPEPGHPESGIPDAGHRGGLAGGARRDELQQAAWQLLADVGEDEQAGRVLVAQANGHASELLVHELSVPPHRLNMALDNALPNVVGPHGEIVGAVEHGLATREREDQLASDQEAEDRRRARITVATGFAKTIASQIPVAGDALGVGIDIGRAQALADRVDTTGATNREVGLLFSTAQEDQRILFGAVVREALPAGIREDLHYDIVRRAENIADQSYESGRLEAEKRLTDYG